MYQLANVYLILLTGSAFNSLSDMIDNPSSILTYISAALPTSSIFFINFIITQVLSGIPLSYMRIGPLLYLTYIRHFTSEKKLTRRTLVEGPLASATVEYGTTLPDALYVLCITLLYWVISPFVLVVSTLYFGGSYLSWKYQYLYIVVRQSESGGQYWYGLYTYSMMGLLASTLTMITYMSIKEAIVQAPLLLPLPLLIVFAWRYTEGRFKALSENVPFSLAVAEDLKAGHVDVTNAFTEDYLKQPNVLAAKMVFPYPYRIGGLPLLDENGLLNNVYLEDLPEGVYLSDPQHKYIPPMYQEEPSVHSPMLHQHGRQHGV
jgi:calcium permeable stress-gated cation channel